MGRRKGRRMGRGWGEGNRYTMNDHLPDDYLPEGGGDSKEFITALNIIFKNKQPLLV